MELGLSKDHFACGACVHMVNGYMVVLEDDVCCKLTPAPQHTS